MRIAGRTLTAIALAVVLILAVCSCGGKRGRIIPDETLSLICADMLVADQWVIDRGMYSDVDTVLIYEPVFNKYGYTSLDFYATLDRQMYYPSKFARVITKSQMILQERGDALDRMLFHKRKDSKKIIYDSGFRTSGVGVTIDSLLMKYETRTVYDK